MFLLRICLLFLVIVPFCSSFNYLIYLPLNARSHINFMSSVANTLSDAGHNVVSFGIRVMLKV